MDSEERRTGVKTSVYLPADVADGWKASGASLAELVRDGLAYRSALHTGEERLRHVIREELAAAFGAGPPQPAARPQRTRKAS